MNLEKLKDRISSSGYKLSYIADACEITRNSLYKKLRGDSEFNRFELEKLKVLLGLSVEEVSEIFFA